MIADFLIIFSLVLSSALFSSLETAFFSIGEIDAIDLEKRKGAAAKLLVKLLKNKIRILSSILIGNNLVNIGVSAYNTIVALRFAQAFGFSEEATVAAFTGVLTVLIIVFGEIVPKNLAIQFNVNLALSGAFFLHAISTVLYPLSLLFEKFNQTVEKIFGAPNKKINDDILLRILHRGAKEGNIDPFEKEFVENVLALGEKTVSSAMTPRVAVFALDEKTPLKEAIPAMMAKKYSRIPIYCDSIDNITGIINLRMLTPDIIAGETDKPLREYAGKVVFLYETQKIHRALERLRKRQTHFAVVVDEFGGICGIITLEDMIEEIVGEIFDEKDVAQKFCEKIGERRWLMSGRTDIRFFNKTTSSRLETDEEYETLQGLIMHLLQRVPKENDVARHKNFTFVVRRMKGKEIISAEIEVAKEASPDSEEEDADEPPERG